MGHIDLAAHLQDRGARHETQRNILQGTQIGGDVLAFYAVAARRALNEQTLLVAQAGRQPVDLGLGRDDEFVVFLETQKAAHTRHKIRHVLVVNALSSDSIGRHARPWQISRWAARRLRGWAVGPHEIGKARLDGGIAPAQSVIVRVGNLGRVVLKVAPVMRGDLVGQSRQFFAASVCESFSTGFTALTRVSSQAFCGAPCASSSNRALRRAPLRSPAPDSMRAISSTRSSSLSNSTRVCRLCARCGNAARRGRRPAANASRAMSALRATRCSRSPTASATAPPTPRSTSSNMSAAGGLALGQRNLQRQREAREFAARGDLRERPNAAPSTVATSKLTRSRPVALPSAPTSSNATRKRAWPSLSGANSPATAFSSLAAAALRAADSFRAVCR
jgi:hypothetical protein